MKVTTSKHLKIIISDDDAEHFITAMSKITTDNNKVGFNRTTLTDQEQNVINRLYKEIKR